MSAAPVKVLLVSPAFPPMVGGLELVAEVVASGLQRLGMEVTVLTEAAASGPETAPYRVVRRPGRAEVLRWTRWCDVFFQANVSLRYIWPLLLMRRPLVAMHQGMYRLDDGSVPWREALKRRVARLATVGVSCSAAVARVVDDRSRVIPNPYRDEVFRVLEGIPRDGELLFVGRLVSEKGAALILDAMKLLGGEGAVPPRLTIVGDGPERAPLEGRARELGIAERVSFAGTRTGEDLVRIMNAHRVLVVPTRSEEPFGIVAVEGLACGCTVVASDGGGLPEAMGPFGIPFRRGDAADLAAALRRALATPAPRTAALEAHLGRHRSAEIARAYHGAVLDALARWRRGR